MPPPKQPFFSIVIPTLNEEKFLPLLLKDLKKQTSNDFEAIVVDGRSHDKTLTLTGRFAFVRSFISPLTNVAYQRNHGAQKARGKFLLFVDADTRLKSSFLATLERRLINDDRINLFTCFLDQPSSRPSERIIINLFNFILEATKLLDRPVALGAFIGCRRQVFLNLGGFNARITFSEDTEFIRRANKTGYRFNLFKEPRFYFSFRRFHKEGTLKLLRQYAKLNLKVVFEGFPVDNGKNYPMLGGTYYQKGKTSSKFIKALDKILREIKKFKPPPQTQRPRLL